MFFCFRFGMFSVLFLCFQGFIFFDLHHGINAVSLRRSSLSGLFVVRRGPLHCGLYCLFLFFCLFPGIFHFLGIGRFLGFCLLFLFSIFLFSWCLLFFFYFGSVVLLLCGDVLVFDVIVVSSSSSLSGRMYVSSSLFSSSVGHSLSLSVWMFQLFLFLPYLSPRPFLTESLPSCSFLVGRLLCALFPLSPSPPFSCIGPQASTPLFFPVLRVESISSSKSDGLNVTFGSVSETFFIRSTTLLFTVFGCRPYSFSNGNFPTAFWPVRNAYKISDRPDFSRFRTMLLFVLKCSLMVRINLSIFPFPRWSRTGQVMCFIWNWLQKALNFSLVNAVPGSVLICFGMPYWAI